MLHRSYNVKDKIEEILELGNIDLLSNAHRLVLYIIEGRDHEMIIFAKQERVAWAKYSMMGCKSVVTGSRPEIVKMMIRKGLTFENKATTKGTLQQALVDYLT